MKENKANALIIACVKLRTTCCGVDRLPLLSMKTEGSSKITNRNIKRLVYCRLLVYCSAKSNVSRVRSSSERNSSVSPATFP